MFIDDSSMIRQDLDEGITRYIYSGDSLQLVRYHFPANTSFPIHSHDSNEQMGMVISGRMGFEVGGETRILNEGEYYHAPVNTPHRAWTLDEPVVLLDIFSPPRSDL
jgi:quercetin dioxygenase-like cupin family protein